MNHLEAERWVIGSLLIDPENIERIRGKVSPEDFLDSSHSKIFAVIEEIHDREDIPLDLTTIYSFLKETEGEEFEIAQYLERDIPTDATLEYWAKVVRRQSLQRKKYASSAMNLIIGIGIANSISKI